MSNIQRVEVFTKEEVVANLDKLQRAFEIAAKSGIDLTLKQAHAIAQAIEEAGLVIGKPLSAEKLRAQISWETDGSTFENK